MREEEIGILYIHCFLDCFIIMLLSIGKHWAPGERERGDNERSHVTNQGYVMELDF